MNFRVGQKVVCIIKPDEQWSCVKDPSLIFPGPKAGEVLVIDYVKPSGHLMFYKYHCSRGFAQEYFRPFIPDQKNVNMEILEKFSPLESRPDCPIKEIPVREETFN